MSAAPVLVSPFLVSIEVIDGPSKGAKYQFNQLNIKIGRGVDNDIVIPDDFRMSRSHLSLQIQERSLYAVNLSEKNLIYIGDKKINREKISKDVKLTLGKTTLRIHYDLPLEQTKPASSKSAPSKSGSSNAPSPLQLTSEASKVQNPITFPSYVPAMTPKVEPKPNQNPKSKSPSDIAKIKAKKRVSANPQSKEQNFTFYIVMGILVIGGFWLFSGKKKPAQDLNRPSNTVWNNTKSYDELMKEFEQRKQKIGSRNFQMAQENFIRGFRDFRQGNYGRAREAFQVVINLDSENEMAIRYNQLAKIKFDELVKFHILQGNRYREKKNWRLCRSSYFNALSMLANRQSDPSFKEAKRFYEECDMALQGRY